jgi:hypothetical protein
MFSMLGALKGSRPAAEKFERERRDETVRRDGQLADGDGGLIIWAGPGPVIVSQTIHR